MPVSTSVLPSPLESVHPNYLVSIHGQDEVGNWLGRDKDRGILAVLPEEFALSTSSMWTPLLNSMAQQLVGSMFGGKFAGINAIAGAIGIGLSNTAFTQLVWESTTPIEFRLPLIFNAVYDAQAEVMEPIMRLLMMTLPSDITDAGSIPGTKIDINQYLPLLAPGPNMKASSQYKVGINIGQAFSFTNVLIKSVNATFKTLSVQSGDFVSADVELEISTTRILTKNDLLKYFNRSGGLKNISNSIG
jgi:hypothetical protein